MFKIRRQRTSTNLRHPLTEEQIHQRCHNLLSDESLFLSSSDSECSEDSDLEFIEELVDKQVHDDSDASTVNSNGLRTPKARIKKYSGLHHPHSNESSSTSISSISSSTNSKCSKPECDQMTKSRNDDPVMTASMLGMSENETFVIFGFLDLQSILKMSKTCSRYYDLSLKLLSTLTIRCKSINGVNTAQINQLIGRCSQYLKSIDLTQVSTVVTDKTIHQIAAHCGHITSLSLHGCMSITNDAVIELLKHCPFLRDLNLSACHQLTSAIGPVLAQCLKLKKLNLSWCSNMDCDITPYLLLMNEKGSLRECILHCTNRHVSLFGAFQECFNSLEKDTVHKLHKLNNPLTITGGLHAKYTNDEMLEQQMEYLKIRNISFVDPRTVDLRSLTECDFEYKHHLLCESKTFYSWRWYTQYNSNKIYLVIHTEYGIFGTKLIPLLDFDCPRVWYLYTLCFPIMCLIGCWYFIISQREFIEKMVSSRRNPVDFLTKKCNLPNWTWIADFQSKRTLSLLGLQKNASWIEHTASQSCNPEDVVHAEPSKLSESNPGDLKPVTATE